MPNRAATGSLGGGGRGDLIFPDPGGGARLTALGFAVPESPAAESIPVPLEGLGFTFILIVSPSYNAKPPPKSEIYIQTQKKREKRRRKSLLFYIDL